MGSLDDRGRIVGSWRQEGAAVLAWALGLIALPSHTALVEGNALGDALGLLAAEPAALRASLRAPREIDAMARRLLGIHWRLREQRTAPGPRDFRAFSRDSWFGGFDLDGIALAGNDLAIGGVPITEASERDVRMCLSIAMERHQAMNWLLGTHPLYSKVETPT
jgi:hypothetical protein